MGDVPDYWVVWMHSQPDWRGRYLRTQSDSPIRGTRSLRLVVPATVESSWHTLQCFRTYTFSCYLKSSREGQKVILRIGTYYTRERVEKEVEVGREWKRYWISAVPKRGTWFGAYWDTMVVGITSKRPREGKPGAVWISAPQLQFGAEHTPYRPADADRKRFRFPVVHSMRGSLSTDAVREPTLYGPLVDGADSDSVPEDYSTYFSVYSDDYNIYILVRANEPRSPDIETKSRPEDPEWKKILYQDSILVYLKPCFEGGGLLYVFCQHCGRAL